MLNVKEAIEQRRSIRSFRPDPVPEDILQQMLEAARLAPSGSNRQPWRFLVVTDQVLKKEIRRIGWDQRFLEEAPVVIVCCADLKAYSKEESKQRRQEFVDFGVIETLSGRFADPKFREAMDLQPEPPLETWVLSAVANTYIAIEHLALTATALGLGTCWVGAFDTNEISRLLNLPYHVIPVILMPVGYPTKVPPPRPRLPLDKILLQIALITPADRVI